MTSAVKGCEGPIRAVALALGIGVAAAGSVQADEAFARERVQAMSDYLAGQATLSFNFNSTLDIITGDDQKLGIASSGSAALARPDKLHAIRRGGFATIEVTFDGATVSILNATADVYTEASIPGSIDNLINTLRDEYGQPLPAADLLSGDVAAILLADVTDVKDLGSGMIGTEECDHFAFRTPEVDWQIWIAQGETPYPCRYAITSTAIAGWPQYTVDVVDWQDGTIPATFAFEPPAGATRVDPADMPDLDEVAGVFVMKGPN